VGLRVGASESESESRGRAVTVTPSRRRARRRRPGPQLESTVHWQSLTPKFFLQCAASDHATSIFCRFQDRQVVGASESPLLRVVPVHARRMTIITGIALGDRTPVPVVLVLANLTLGLHSSWRHGYMSRDSPSSGRASLRHSAAGIILMASLWTMPQRVRAFEAARLFASRAKVGQRIRVTPPWMRSSRSLLQTRSCPACVQR
jgi:hypothetical protein